MPRPANITLTSLSDTRLVTEWLKKHCRDIGYHHAKRCSGYYRQDRMKLRGYTRLISAPAGLLTHRSGRNVVMEGSVESHLWPHEPYFILSQVKIGNAKYLFLPDY